MVCGLRVCGFLRAGGLQKYSVVYSLLGNPQVNRVTVLEPDESLIEPFWQQVKQSGDSVLRSAEDKLTVYHADPLRPNCMTQRRTAKPDYLFVDLWEHLDDDVRIVHDVVSICQWVKPKKCGWRGMEFG